MMNKKPYQVIMTGENTWREMTAADRLEKVIDTTKKEKAQSGKKERLDWKLLIGLIKPI